MKCYAKYFGSKSAEVFRIWNCALFLVDTSVADITGEDGENIFQDEGEDTQEFLQKVNQS